MATSSTGAHHRHVLWGSRVQFQAVLALVSVEINETLISLWWMKSFKPSLLPTPVFVHLIMVLASHYLMVHEGDFVWLQQSEFARSFDQMWMKSLMGENTVLN